MKVFLALIISCILSQPTYSCTLRLGIETSFAPYIIQHEDSWRGINVELLQRLVQEIGCELEFIHSPWLRSLKLIEQGELDVLSHLSYNTERSRQFAFIGPHQQESIYLVGLASAFSGITGVEQLHDKNTAGIVALLNGAYYGDQLDSILNDADNRTRFVFIRGNEDKQALLLNGRVQGVLEDIAAYHYWKELSGLSKADYVPLFQVHQSLVYFGFNLNTISSIQLKQLEQAWQKLYEDGTLAAIVKKYPLSGIQLELPKPASLLPEAE